MKAVYQTKYGKSDVLIYGEQISPALSAKEIRIKNYATSVNPRDWLIRSGRYQLQFLVPKFPLILGSDFAGEITEIGAKVVGYSVGDKVFGMKNPSEGLATYASEVVVSAKNIAQIPNNISFNEAAGVPLCSLTAWQALVDKAGIKEGMKVLVIGASGGVGSYGVQIAKALGGDITAVCSEKNTALATSLGASKVINYHKQDFLKEGGQYDIVFDTIGRHDFNKCTPVLNNGGVYVSTIPSPNNLKSMGLTTIKSLFSKSTKKSKVVMVKPNNRDLAEVAALIYKGRVTPVIDQVYPLEQASDAHDHSRSMRAKGKIILEVQ